VKQGHTLIGEPVFKKHEATPSEASTPNADQSPVAAMLTRHCKGVVANHQTGTAAMLVT
jgi:hypothetical protein